MEEPMEVDPEEESLDEDVETARLMEKVVNGFKGPETLHALLSKPKKAKTFLNAIKKFQNDNEIEVESLASALHFLDMHGYPRAKFAKQAVIDLSDYLLECIKVIGRDAHHDPSLQRKLEIFLRKIFHLHKIKMIRPLVIEILQHLPSMEEEHVDVIAGDQELYSACSIHILRHVWLKHHHLFYKDLQPVVNAYYRSKYSELYSVDPSRSNFFTGTISKERRQTPEVQKMMEMVGLEFKLYKHLLNYIRVCFEESGDVILCSLRTELIMAAHDAGNENFTRLDHCHELAWCLDVCMRDKGLDSNHATKMKAIIDVCCGIHHIIVGDLAMVCADPHVVHFLAGFIVRKVRDNAYHLLPRDIPSVTLAARILALGIHAETIAKTKRIPHSMLDTIFFSQFLAALASSTLEDVMFLERIEDPETNEGIPFGQVNDLIAKFVRVDRLAAIVYLHHVLDLLPTKGRVFHKILLNRYSPLLTCLNGHIAADSIWGYLFTDRVISSTSKIQFISEDHYWLKLLMEDILFPRITESSDPFVRFNNMRFIYVIGYCWGVEPCRDMFCKFNKLPLENFETSSLALEMYKMAHQKVMDCLWPKSMVPPQPPEGACANGHEGCIYQCPATFIYGDSPEFPHRLNEYLQGFNEPAYLRLPIERFKYSDDKEDFFHLACSNE